MPDGWKIAILMGDDKAFPITDAYLADSPDLQLIGNVLGMVTFASAMGELHYFARERLYAIPVLVPGHALGNLKFWWLFRDYNAPETAEMTRPIEWARRVPFVAALSCSEYACQVMMQLFEIQVEEEPDSQNWAAERVMAWMRETFEQTPMYPAVTTIQGVPDDDPEFEPVQGSAVFTFVDGSIARLDINGWLATDSGTCVVPKLSGKEGGNKRMYREVKVHATEDGRNWYQ